MKLRIPWGVALVAASLALAACSGDSDHGRGRSIDACCGCIGHAAGVADGVQPDPVRHRRGQRDPFRKKHPNVDVEVELQQWPGIQDKLTTALGAESPPDVVEVGNKPHGDVRRRRDSWRTCPEYAGDLKIADMLPGLDPCWGAERCSIRRPLLRRGQRSLSTTRPTSPPAECRSREPLVELNTAAEPPCRRPTPTTTGTRRSTSPGSTGRALCPSCGTPVGRSR